MTLSIVETPVPLRTDAHGTVRIGGTRVTLDTVVHAFWDGADAEDIVRAFSTLELADVYAVLSYYLKHRAEVDAYLEQQERDAAIIRRKIEAHPGMTRIRERLLARQAVTQTQD